MPEWRGYMTAENLPGRLYGGRYMTTRLIGRGAFGSVWEADDRQLGRRVALKTANPAKGRAIDPLERFHREALAAAKLSHPNIAYVIDLGEEEGEPFLVQELVPGRPLSAILAREGPISAERAAGIGAQVASALAAAHEVGVVHGDVKPANLMVTPEGRVKVTDFGAADAPWLPQNGTRFATPGYAAPEVIAGKAPSAASDIYSLGIVLFESTQGGLTEAHRVYRVPLPSDLRRLIERSLSAPADRPSARSLSSGFSRLADSAAPPSSPTVPLSTDRSPTIPIPLVAEAEDETKGMPRRRRVGTYAALALILAALLIPLVAAQAGNGGSAGTIRSPAPSTTAPAPSSSPSVVRAQRSPTSALVTSPVASPVDPGGPPPWSNGDNGNHNGQGGN
jgi:serine/threonine protein kinase